VKDYDEREQKLLRARLDRRAAELDDLTVARLRAARKRALAAADEKKHAARWLPWSMAAAAVLVLTLGITLQLRAPENIIAAAPEDVDVLLVKDSPDFTDELEFYRWLEEEQDAG
jgi:hypothetical protein